MKRIALTTILLIGTSFAFGGPIGPPAGNPVRNSANPQDAQMNIGTATVRGTMTAGFFSGNGSALTGVTASSFTASTNASLIGDGTSGAPLGVNPSSVPILSSGLILNSQINGSSITKQGNTFNGTSQLVQTSGTGALPALSGAALTSITAANISAGNLGSSVIASSLAINSVGTGQISALAVTDAKINDVAASKISAGSLGSSVIASSIALNAVGTDQIAALAVTAAKIAANTITNAKLNAETYTNITLPAANVAAGSLGGSVIASSIAASGVAAATYGSSTQAPQIIVAGDGRITSASNVTVTPAASSIASGSLGSSVIASSIALNAVGTGQLAASAVTAAKIANNVITDTQVANGTFTNIAVPATNINAGSLGASVIASSVSLGAIGTGQLAASSVTDAKTNLSTAAIASGLFGDNRVAISTNGVTSGTWPIARGGTSATSAGAALTALGAAASGTNADITKMTALTSVTSAVTYTSTVTISSTDASGFTLKTSSTILLGAGGICWGDGSHCAYTAPGNGTGDVIAAANNSFTGANTFASSTTFNGSIFLPFATQGSTFVITANGFVGIGTANPSTKLHMSSGTFLLDGSNATITLDGANPSFTVGTSTFVVLSNGFVGLSTAAPVWPLTIVDYSSTGKDVTQASNTNRVLLGLDSNHGGALLFMHGGTQDGSSSNSAITMRNEGGSSGSSVAQIQLQSSSGTYGNPAQQQSADAIIGRFDFQSWAGTGFKGLGRIETRTQGVPGSATSEPAYMTFSVASTNTVNVSEKMRIIEDGSLLIGGTVNSGTLVVKSTVATAGSFVQRNQNSSAADLFNVGADGKVGIGTTSPATNLQITGTADASNGNIKIVPTAADYSGVSLYPRASGAATASRAWLIAPNYDQAGLLEFLWSSSSTTAPTNGASVMMSSNSLMVGSTSPGGSMMSVNGGMAVGGNAYLTKQADGTIAADKLGLGLTGVAPATTLEVNGTTKLEGATTLTNAAAATFNSTATFNSQTLFTNSVSTQAKFSGWNRYDGASGTNGRIQIGSADADCGVIDYGSTGGTLRIENTYNGDGKILFNTKTAGTTVTGLTVESAGGITTAGGTSNFGLTTSTQAIFKGFSNVLGAYADSGLIAIGNPASNSAYINYEGNNGDLYIDNGANSATSDIIFRTRTNGTAINAMTITGAGPISISSQTTFSLNTSTQAIFKSWAGVGGAYADSGQITVGNPASNYSSLMYDGLNGDLYVDNGANSATSDIIFRTRVNGTPITAMTIAGTGATTVSTLTVNNLANFSNAYSTQSISKGFASHGGANSASGQIEIGGTGVDMGLRLSYDNAVTGDAFIESGFNSANGDIIFNTRADGTPVNSLTLNSVSSTFYGSTTTFNSDGTVSLGTSVGAGTQLFYCNGGTFTGNLCRGAACICTGGTATGLGIYVK